MLLADPVPSVLSLLPLPRRWEAAGSLGLLTSGGQVAQGDLIGDPIGAVASRERLSILFLLPSGKRTW